MIEQKLKQEIEKTCEGKGKEVDFSEITDVIAVGYNQLSILLSNVIATYTYGYLEKDKYRERTFYIFPEQHFAICIGYDPIGSVIAPQYLCLKYEERANLVVVYEKDPHVRQNKLKALIHEFANECLEVANVG